MKKTNKWRLPEPLVRALKNDQYVKRGDISVTSLIDAPKIVALRDKYWDQLEEDVIDNVWSMFGTACHHIIELATDKPEQDKIQSQLGVCKGLLASKTVEPNSEHGLRIQKIIEKLESKQQDITNNARYLSEIKLSEVVDGWTVTGTADLYDKETKTLYDFKVTSVWKVKGDDDHQSWQAQMNCYAHFLRKRGYPVENIRIIAILKDWNRREAAKDAQSSSQQRYPQKQIAEVVLPVYKDEAMGKYIKRQVARHQEAKRQCKSLPEDQLQDSLEPCTDKDRWQTSNTYAVMATGKKRALRVLSSYDEAVSWAQEKGLDPAATEIVERLGKSNRCGKWCPVFKWCKQKDNLITE